MLQLRIQNPLYLEVKVMSIRPLGSNDPLGFSITDNQTADEQSPPTSVSIPDEPLPVALPPSSATDDLNTVMMRHRVQGLVARDGQDVQAEARQLIAAHTNYYISLDEDGLGRDLASRVGGRPELVREVFRQLGSSDRVQVARVMVGTLSDDQLRDIVWDGDGLALLYDINRWVANNELTGDGQANAVEDRRLRERIGVALTRRDDIREITTQQLANTQAVRGRNAQEVYPPRYTAEDVRRLFGRDGYARLDDWVNRIARGEGGFATAGDVGDGNKLSVGIFQWTQTTGRLGDLMQKYKEVAEREGRLNEFYEVFGGRDRAEQLLQTLNDRATAGNIAPSSIQSMFAEAGRRDVFQRAQVELARDEARLYIRTVAPYLPYTAADGSVSGRMLAGALIVKNIGGAPDSPAFVRRAMERTISELYMEVARNNPAVDRQLQERLAAVRQETTGLSASRRQEALEAATKDFKKAIVEANVTEEHFLERLTIVAPRVLYTTQWKYDRYHRGVENRIRETINSVDRRERVNPNEI